MDYSRSLPEVVRIKRKRCQDSLQALILETPKNKRVKDELYVFKLQRTDNETVHLKNSNNDSTLPLLQESENLKNKGKTFIIPRALNQDEKLPDEFTEMLDSVLNFEQKKPKVNELLKKPTRKHKPFNVTEIPEIDLEYVYDVYYRDKAVHESWEKDNVGYIKFEEQDDSLNQEDDSNPELSDEEDSNAEDFYRNDYPEDEDAHSLIGDEDKSSVELIPESEINRVRNEMLKSELQEHNSDFNLDENEIEQLYDDFYADDENDSTDVLSRLNNADDADFPRQNFFPGEEDDELAKHRDRIFHQLEKMIHE